MTLEEALSFIHQTDWKGNRPGLERMEAMMRHLGDPHKKLKFVHVAGTNGKGSTCAMLASILTAAGYRTGLYTSPHLDKINERIAIDGTDICDADFVSVAEQVRAAAEGISEAPSEFEIITAMALYYFARKQCDIVVLEVGLGGRLDATNVIPAPEAAVITNIGLDHTEILGNTLVQIAREKAGIIKTGCDCICYHGKPEVVAVFQKACAERQVPFHCADFLQVQDAVQGIDGQSFTWNGTRYFIPLLGNHQLRNASVVLETADILRQRGWRIGTDAIVTGLQHVRWPARMEVLGKNPLFILDGGHNPQCAQALADSLKTLLPSQKVTFLIGVLADKDYEQIIAPLLPLAKEFVCLTPDSERALSAEDLKDYLVHMGSVASSWDDPQKAIRYALHTAGKNGAIAALGSLYLTGQIRDAYISSCNA